MCVPINTVDGMLQQFCQSQGQFLKLRALSDTIFSASCGYMEMHRFSPELEACPHLKKFPMRSISEGWSCAAVKEPTSLF